MAVFCPNCGTQNSDSDKFCQSCGGKLEAAAQPESITYSADNAAGTGNPADNTQPNYGAPVQENTTAGLGGAGVKKSMNPIPLIIAAAALIFIIVIAVILKSVFSYQKIDAKELFDVEFAGPDGYGVCYAQLDIDPTFAYTEYDVDMEDYSLTKAKKAESDAETAIEGSKKKKSVEYSKYFSDERKELEKAYPKAKSKSDAKDMRDALLKVNKDKHEFKLKVKPSKSSGLKNGDKVTLEVDFDEEYLKENKIKLENTSWEVEVKGLENAVSIDDAFSGFAPKFSGLDGEGRCDYDSYSGDYKFIYYYSDGSTYSLSNGDKVKFIAACEIYDYNYLDEKDESKGFWFKYEDKYYVWPYAEMSVDKEFDVSGLQGLEVLDPADEIELEYSGASPFLDVSADLKEGSKFSGDLSVGVEDDYNDRYKVGDKVKVKVYGYYGLKEAGYKLKDADEDGYAYVEITIPDTVPHYATALEAVEANNALAQEFADTETTLKQYVQDNKYIRDGVTLEDYCKSVSSIKVVSNYYTSNDITVYENLGYGATINRISRVYKLDLKLKNDGKQTIYVVASVDNIINTDGTYSTDNSVKYTFFDKNRDAIESVEGLEGFTVTAFGNETVDTPTESKTDESKADESKADESAADESKADESSAADESKADESKADESKADGASSEEKVP